MKKSWVVIVAAIPLVIVGSIAVWQLSANDGRRVGALGPIREPMPLAWRGTWTGETRYDVGQVVSYQGSSYVAEAPNAERAPGPKCGADCPWALMAAMGPGGPQGPSGNPISLDDLDGLPCRPGDPAEGIVDILYSQTDADHTAPSTVTLQCKPTNLVMLTVHAVATPQTSMVIGTSAFGGTYRGCGAGGGWEPPTATCEWFVRRNTTVTLVSSPGQWSGACSGGAPECTVVMSEDRSVTKTTTAPPG